MSDEERKRIIDEALHGARSVPESKPKDTSTMGPWTGGVTPAVTPCCAHCINKMGYAPPSTQIPYYPPQGVPMPANPFANQFSTGNQYLYGANQLTGVPFQGQATINFNGFSGTQTV